MSQAVRSIDNWNGQPELDRIRSPRKGDPIRVAERGNMQIAVSRRDNYNFICSTELWWPTETQPLVRKGASRGTGELGWPSGMGVWQVDARRLPNW